MKFIGAAVLSYAAVAFYMIFLNPTAYAWMPALLIVVLLVQRYADYQYTVWVALMTGLFADMHYQYLGPYVCMLLVAVLLAHWLEGSIGPRQEMLSTLVVFGLASIWYVAALFVLSGLLNGFQYYYHGIGTIYQLLGIIGCAWAASFICFAVAQLVARLYRYARR